MARDPDTGELGVAVQSHWFSVGPLVPWARPGVGAVATQASIQVAYGPHGLDLLAEGLEAQQALERLVAADELASVRQVAIVDARGGVAAHTGEGCMAFAGHITGDAVSCQANIMASASVWPAMLESYRAAPGPLAGRLLAALEAAEAEGGDLRGRQSAAVLVVPASGEGWEATMSLRVEDHPDPLVELRRLMRIHAAYARADAGDAALAEGAHERASELYREASELAPENLELRFWSGLGAAQLGDLETGVALVSEAIDGHPPWLQLLERLPPDVAPAAPAVLARIREGASPAA